MSNISLGRSESVSDQFAPFFRNFLAQIESLGGKGRQEGKSGCLLQLPVLGLIRMTVKLS